MEGFVGFLSLVKNVVDGLVMLSESCCFGLQSRVQSVMGVRMMLLV